MSRIERRKQERLDEVRRFAKESDIPVHNMELLNVALTHTSYANEHRNLKVHDNERLEFWGRCFGSGSRGLSFPAFSRMAGRRSDPCQGKRSVQTGMCRMCG